MQIIIAITKQKTCQNFAFHNKTENSTEKQRGQKKELQNR